MTREEPNSPSPVGSAAGGLISGQTGRANLAKILCLQIQKVLWLLNLSVMALVEVLELLGLL